MVLALVALGAHADTSTDKEDLFSGPISKAITIETESIDDGPVAGDSDLEADSSIADGPLADSLGNSGNHLDESAPPSDGQDPGPSTDPPGQQPPPGQGEQAVPPQTGEVPPPFARPPRDDFKDLVDQEAAKQGGGGGGPRPQDPFPIIPPAQIDAQYERAQQQPPGLIPFGPVPPLPDMSGLYESIARPVSSGFGEFMTAMANLINEGDQARARYASSSARFRQSLTQLVQQSAAVTQQIVSSFSTFQFAAAQTMAAYNNFVPFNRQAPTGNAFNVNPSLTSTTGGFRAIGTPSRGPSTSFRGMQ